MTSPHLGAVDAPKAVEAPNIVQNAPTIASDSRSIGHRGRQWLWPLRVAF